MVAVSFVPQVGTPVSVMFVGGDPTQPIWFGNFALPIPPPVVIEAGPPVANGTQLGEIWYDSSNGMKTYEWNGASWIAYQLGTGGVASGIGLTEPNITGGTITGSRFIADGTSGEFLGYTGSPATGNMNVSVSPVAGADGKGNGYQPGVTVYDGSAYVQVSVNSVVGAPAIGLKTGVASENGVAALYNWSPNKGAANEYLENYWQGPSSTSDGKSASVVLQSTNKDGTGGAAGLLVGPTGTMASWDTNGFHVSSKLYGNSGTLTIQDVVQTESDIHIAGSLFGVGGIVTVGDKLQADTWHNAATDGTLFNWTVASGGVARYKKMPDNTIMLHFTNIVSGITTDGQIIWTPPSGYGVASSVTQNFPVAWAVSGTATPTGMTSPPSVYMSGGGLRVIGMQNLTPAVVGISFVIRCALD